jgi:hypothetical protein
MKTGILAVVILAVLSLGAAAPKADNTVQRVEAAVKTAVSAHVKKQERTMGSADVSVAGSTVTSINTRALSGWTGRYESTGTVDVTLKGKSITTGTSKQSRGFSALITVENGAAQVTDVRLN